MIGEYIEKLGKILQGKSNTRLYIYGAGNNGRALLPVLVDYEKKANAKFIAAFIDNNKAIYGQDIDGIKILNKADLKTIASKEDVFVVISMAKKELAYADLDEIGVADYLYVDKTMLDYCFKYDSFDGASEQPWEKAVRWMLTNITDEGGVLATSGLEHAYPEVTGYYIPTMIEYGYVDEAVRAAEWLLTFQSQDGGFRGIEGTPDYEREFVFDSGQILRGLIAVRDLGEKDFQNRINEAILRTCEYLISQMIDDGKGGYQKQYEDGSYAVEPIMIYTLPPLNRAAELLNRNDWKEKAKNCLNYYKGHKDYLSQTTLTHFLAYQMEALIELGEPDSINEIFKYIENAYSSNGYVPGHKDTGWFCSTGNAQIAICAFRTGRYELGEKILLDLEKYQLATGGFFGSYGDDADYFPTTEISWAVKYFLDANRLHIAESFNYQVGIFPEDIDVDQAEMKAVLELVDSIVKEKGPAISIAEIGCGKGRFLKQIHSLYPEIKLTGVDISEEMLKAVPDYVEKHLGKLEHIELKDECYDLVLCVEALEHSINVPVSIKELCRIACPNGTVVIIDKNITAWGRFETPDWEKWFDKEKLLEHLKEYCKKVECNSLDMFGDDRDDMFLMWVGKKTNV